MTKIYSFNDSNHIYIRRICTMIIYRLYLIGLEIWRWQFFPVLIMNAQSICTIVQTKNLHIKWTINQNQMNAKSTCQSLYYAHCQRISFLRNPIIYICIILYLCISMYQCHTEIRLTYFIFMNQINKK